MRVKDQAGRHRPAAGARRRQGDEAAFIPAVCIEADSGRGVCRRHRRPGAAHIRGASVGTPGPVLRRRSE